jgi:DNA-binding NarL/FixJ family response regulator
MARSCSRTRASSHCAVVCVRQNSGSRHCGRLEHMESLTNREMQIILMVAGGLSNKEVGRRLHLSEGTVKVHLHNIYKKASGQ